MGRPVLRGFERSNFAQYSQTVQHAARSEAIFAADKGVEALEREHEVGAALVVGHGVDFVHDDGANAGEIGAGFLRGEEDEEGLGRGDEDVGRLLEHGAAFGGKRVAGADRGANGRAEVAALKGELLYLLQWLFEVLADVVGERFERRDVDDFGVRLKLARQRFAEELVNADEEGGERFSGAGGRGDQGGACGEDGRPALDLWLGRGAEAGEKPLLEDGVRPCEGLGWSSGLHWGIVAPGFRCFFARMQDDEAGQRFPKEWKSGGSFPGQLLR